MIVDAGATFIAHFFAQLKRDIDATIGRQVAQLEQTTAEIEAVVARQMREWDRQVAIRRRRTIRLAVDNTHKTEG